MGAQARFQQLVGHVRRDAVQLRLHVGIEDAALAAGGGPGGRRLGRPPFRGVVLIGGTGARVDNRSRLRGQGIAAARRALQRADRR